MDRQQGHGITVSMMVVFESLTHRKCDSEKREMGGGLSLSAVGLWVLGSQQVMYQGCSPEYVDKKKGGSNQLGSFPVQPASGADGTGCQIGRPHPEFTLGTAESPKHVLEWYMNTVAVFMLNTEEDWK